MKTIAFSIQKGGVGKTSMAVSLAVELAKETGNLALFYVAEQLEAGRLSISKAGIIDRRG